MLHNVLLFCFLCLFASYPVFADVYQDIEKGNLSKVEAFLKKNGNYNYIKGK